MSQVKDKKPKPPISPETSKPPIVVPFELPRELPRKQAILSFKQHQDEKFKPIKGCKGYYYISNYGTVVSARTSKLREIHGFRFTKLKPGSHKISLVHPDGVKNYLLAQLVYTHFCGELLPDQKVLILENHLHPFYYKNLKAVSIPPIEKPPKPAKIPAELAILNFKKYEDEEFKPIKGFDGDYYISNYGRVVSFKRRVGQEIFGLKNSKEKPGRLQISLVQSGWPKNFFLAHLVYSHFCGEIPPGGNVIIVKKSRHLFYYKNLKAVPVPQAIKPAKPPTAAELAKIPKEQLISTFKRYNDEEFKPIEGCNGDYYISNYGRVVSFRGIPKEIHGNKRDGKAEHYGVSLQHRYSRQYYLVTRLVYSHFCGELKPSQDVIILRKTPRPHYYKNLKTVPRAEFQYSPSAGYLKELRARKTWNIPILQFDRSGKFLREFPGIEPAAAALGIQPLDLYRSLCGKQKKAGGFQWRFRMDPNFDEGICDIPPVSMGGKTVYQFSLEGNFIGSFLSIATAARKTGEPRQYICLSIYGQYKKDSYPFRFQWRFAHDPLFKKGIVALPPVKKQVNLLLQPVVRFTLAGDYVDQYASIYEAAKRTGNSTTVIGQCIRGLRKKVGQYRWYLLEDVDRGGKIENLPTIEHKNICQFDKDGKFLREFIGLSDAARAVGVNRTAIYLCINGFSKTSAGFQWRAKKEVYKNGKIIDIEPLSKPSNK